jgi:hypothetical protein
MNVGFAGVEVSPPPGYGLSKTQAMSPLPEQISRAIVEDHNALERLNIATTRGALALN